MVCSVALIATYRAKIFNIPPSLHTHFDDVLYFELFDRLPSLRFVEYTTRVTALHVIIAIIRREILPFTPAIP